MKATLPGPTAFVDRELDNTRRERAVALFASWPEFTDDALALQFAERHKDRLRYLADRSKWMCWDGTRWQEDRTGLATDLVREHCRDASEEAKAPTNDAKLSTSIASAKTVAAVERLSRVDRRLAATTEQWDCNAWLLNTPAGTIDLRTGAIKEHSPKDYITKITAVSPGGACPLFDGFLSRITDGDVDLQAFLARVFGYSLTGSTKEHALFFCYGDGANGKSVLLNTVSSVVGDYACTAPIETFTASKFDRHPTELARLHGARLVTATETERARAWAESRIKALTAGDKIAARFMYRDFFEFVPIFKLIIAGNHKPGLGSVDEAIRRRLHMMPFSVTIPPEERDPDLFEKLRKEWPGIFQWMLDGCADWLAVGLRPPKIVTDATKEYLDEQDALGAWMDECCEQREGASDRSSNLYASFKHWAEQAVEPVGSNKSFAAELRKRGFKKDHKKSGSIFEGIRVRPDSYSG